MGRVAWGASMTTYRTIASTLAVLPKGASIFDEGVTHIEIKDEGAGPYLEIRQEGEQASGTIAIGADSWPAIRKAVDRMLRSIATMEDAHAG